MSKSVKNKIQKPINYQLKGIELIESCLNNPKNAVADLNVFHYDIRIEHKVNFENKFVAVIMSLNLYNKNRDFNLGNITTSCIFEVLNLSDYNDSESNKVNLPEEFLTIINSITISTTRGIMFNQFKGTFLHNAILPIVDPSAFVVQK